MILAGHQSLKRYAIIGSALRSDLGIGDDERVVVLCSSGQAKFGLSSYLAAPMTQHDENHS